MAWKNNNSVRQVSPLIKQFAWDCVQDMVVVGQRKHRANQNKNCLEVKTGYTETKPKVSVFHNTTLTQSKYQINSIGLHIM